MSPAAAVLAPAGPDLLGGSLLQPVQPGTPNGVTLGARVNGNRKKGGLIKTLTQVWSVIITGMVCHHHFLNTLWSLQRPCSCPCTLEV